jgi:hypothetical protein
MQSTNSSAPSLTSSITMKVSLGNPTVAGDADSDAFLAEFPRCVGCCPLPPEDGVDGCGDDDDECENRFKNVCLLPLDAGVLGLSLTLPLAFDGEASGGPALRGVPEGVPGVDAPERAADLTVDILMLVALASNVFSDLSNQIE